MTIPPGAIQWSEPMDPADVVDWVIDLRGMLEEGEDVEDFTLVLSAEAVAMGLAVSVGGGRDATLVDASTGLTGGANALKIWLEVDEADQLDAAFEGSGVTLPMELTIHTNSVPARTRQRTIVIRVGQL